MIGRPLPVQLVLETLEVGESDWFNTVDTLKSERIFTQTVDGQPWFHEQRRRWLVDSLSPTERQSGAARIIPAVSELAQSQVGWRYGPTLAELIEEAGTEIVDPDFKRLSVLSDSELAIAAALLELDSTRSNPTDAAAALAHARRFFGADGDLVAALERLTLAGLTAVEQVLPGRVPLVEMSFGRAIAVAVGGMCHRRLGMDGRSRNSQLAQEVCSLWHRGADPWRRDLGDPHRRGSSNQNSTPVTRLLRGRGPWWDTHLRCCNDRPWPRTPTCGCMGGCQGRAWWKDS